MAPRRTITPDLLREAQHLINIEGLSQKQAAERLGISQSGLWARLRLAPQDAADARGSRPGATVSGDDATVVSTPSPDLSDIPSLLRERNLNPDDWTVENVVVNEWDGADGSLMRQLKIHLKRKVAIDFILPASDVKPRPRPKVPRKTKPRLVVCVPDQHAPYHDPAAHRCLLQFLSDQEPAEGVFLGDTGDYPSISRHRDNPAWSASAQDCIQASFEVLSDAREACPETRWRKLLGNHDFRLQTELLARAERMYGIKPAAIGGQQQDSALSLRNLLHLDLLGVELVEPEREGDGYEHAQAKLSPYLGARHGWLTGNNSANKTLDRLGHSVIVGHTHAQVVTHKTVYGIDGNPRVLTSVEAGTMAQIKDGLGYAVRPNWQQGFATAVIWPDGTFKVDLATFVDDVLYWRDHRYTAKPRLRRVA